MTRRRVSAIRLLGLILGSMLLLVLAMVFFFHRAAERRWSAMEGRVRELRSRIEARGMHRSILRGQPEPGDASADYAAAIQAASGSLFRDSEPSALFGGLGKGDPRTDDAVLEYCRKIADAIRRGASRESYVPLKGGRPTYLGHPWDVTPAVVAAAYRARLLVESGHRREAYELLLDACQFARDLDAPVSMPPPLTGLSDLLRSKALAKEDFAEIARELAILDSGFPCRAEAAELRLLHMGTAFLTVAGSAEDDSVLWIHEPDLIDWREGYSLRLVKANGFHAADQICTVLRRWDDLPWEEDCREWADPQALAFAGENQAASRFRTDSMSFDDIHRGVLAQVRVLRVAAHFRATGEVLDLPDPFGSRIRTLKTGEGLRVWSLGDVGSPIEGKSEGYIKFQFHPRPDDPSHVIDLEVPP